MSEEFRKLENEQESERDFSLIREEIVRQLEITFKDEFCKLLDEGFQPGRIDEKKIEMLRAEGEFFVRVLSAVKRAVEQNPGNVTALFDIDETIGVPYHIGGGKVITKLRPSLFPLLDRLKAMGLEIGFLTSRDKAAVEAQLGDKKNLKPIAPYVNKDLVFPSGDYPTIGSSRFSEEIGERFGGEHGIIDDVSARTDEAMDLSVNGAQQKITAVQEIRKQIPGKALVVVDDLAYPKFFNERNGVYGVSLARGNGNFCKPEYV